GQWNFSGQASGLGLADFLLGRVATLDQSGLSGVSFYQWYHGAYAQDTWRLSNRVTINAGLRWEPFFSQNLTRGANSILCATASGRVSGARSSTTRPRA